MATEEQCTRYAAAIRTAAGKTVEDPMGWVDTYGDYSDWKAVATSLVEVTEANVGILHSTGGAIAAAIGQSFASLTASLEALPGFWSLEVGSDKMVSYAQASQMAILVARSAACELAVVEDAIVAVGGNPLIPYKGIRRPKPGDDTYLDEVATGAGFGIILLAGLWWLSRD